MAGVFSLSGKVALITGGARGLGKAFAARVLERGGLVGLADLNTSQGHETLAEFEKAYGSGRACFVTCDVTNKTQLENAFQETEKALGRISVLCNNAGIAPMMFEQNELCVAINLTAVINGTAMAYERMAGNGGGVVINIASMAGIVPVPLTPVYAATKAGVVNFSRSCAPIFKKAGVRVNCICPAFTRTNMVTDNLDNSMFRKTVEHAGGVMEPKAVVDAFETAVTDERHVGSVMMVTPRDGVRLHKPDTEAIAGMSKL